MVEQCSHGDCGLQGKEGRLITFGHGARHLVETDVAQGVVESAIGTEIEDIVRQASRTGSFWGRVKVGAKIIEYRAYTLRSGDIHVGTYYPV
jgi:methenyltetrahydromethanopterin cyclohydrolase